MTRAVQLVLTILGAVLLTGAAVHALAAGEIPPIDQPATAESGDTSPKAFDSLIEGQMAQPAPSPADCRYGEQDSGAQYYICTPTVPWNGDLLVYAHGYVAPDRPVEIPQDQMVLGDISITETLTSLGFAFATTSYWTNGLAVRPAISDLLDLVNIFTTTREAPEHIYLAGVSEGGLITALSVEQHPEVYDGGLAMCGPYGDFQGQINHFGDFRVVFDYFFRDLMPGEPLSIPTSLQEDWEAGLFTEKIQPAITDPANAVSVTELLTVTGVSPYEYAPPTSTDSIEQLLWYNVFATNDGIEKLGGQPFDNKDPWRTYSGSNDDERLNDPEQGVRRVSANPAAMQEMEKHYETTGDLRVPLVTVHTTGDEVVPYWHAILYDEKVASAGNSLHHEHLKVDNHGHCAFGYLDILGAFMTLVDMVENPPTNIFLPAILKVP